MHNFDSQQLTGVGKDIYDLGNV